MWEAVKTVPTKEEWLAALFRRHGEENQKRFLAATVAVCGLGGLGSNIALTLARVGIGKLILIDFDRVDITNLHRQQYNVSQIGMLKTKAVKENLLLINPYIQTKTHTLKITEENAVRLLREADVICEAFDCAEAKAMLANLVSEKLPNKYYVASSGMAGFGEANVIQTKKFTEHFYVCGDFVSDTQDCVGLVASRVTICAAHQAHKVLQILLKEENTNES